MEQPPFVMRIMFMQRYPVLLLKKKADEKGRFVLESRKKQRACVVDAKAAEIKLEGSTAHCCPPAPITSAFHGAIAECASLAAVGNSWRVNSSKGFALRRGFAGGGGEARNLPLWQIQADAAV